MNAQYIMKSLQIPFPLKIILSFVMLFGTFLFAFGQDPYVTVWMTNPMFSDNPDQITIPAEGMYDYSWEELDDPDNTGSGSGDGEITIIFPNPGIYKLEMTPTGENPFHRIVLGGSSDQAYYKIRDVLQWGDAVWSSFENAYNGVWFSEINTEDIPDLSQVTSMKGAFANADLETINRMNEWDVSNVTDMSDMFHYAEFFNEDITDWDVSNVEDMSNMFAIANAFNQPIGNWDVSSVTDMSGMFIEDDFLARPAAQNKGFNVTEESDWDEWGFDHPIGDWDVSNVTDMTGMFSGAFKFNQPIGDWDVSNVTEMSGIFAGAEFFNQPLNDWDVSNITNMQAMFGDAKSFNQPLDNWDVSNVDNMMSLFNGASAFNQPLNDWNVSNVMEFHFTFFGAGSFNQSLEDWVFASDAQANGIFWNSGMDCKNFSLSLKGWADNPQTGTDVFFLADLEYSPEVVEELNYLSDTLNWSFQDLTEGNCTLSTNMVDTPEFKVFPNPTKNQVTIEGLSGEEQLSLFDINGRNLQTYQVTKKQFSFALDGLSKGVYFIVINSDGNTPVQKRIIKN